MVYLDVVCLNYDGGVLDAAVLACAGALRKRKPLHGWIVHIRLRASSNRNILSASCSSGSQL